MNKALIRLAERPHVEYRNLVLFPGVEITTNNGVHLLGLFAPGTDGVRIAQVLSDVGYKGRFGESDVASNASVIEAAKAVRDKSGLPILAHVDKAAGAFRVMQGNALSPLLDAGVLAGIEVVDPTEAHPEVFTQKKLRLAEVLGSDAHRPSGKIGQRYPGSHFTWVKMDTPTIEGLHLALLDGAALSLQRSDEESDDPNECHGELLIESVEIDRARFAGRGNPLEVRFSPWLSTLIGGRGSGKSTVIQLLRWVFGPGDELPETVRKDFEDFAKVWEPVRGVGALTPETRVTVVLRRGGSRYRLVRSLNSLDPSVEEDTGEGFVPAEPGIFDTLPVRILAQKEILELASEPEKLPALLDRAPEIEFKEWRADWNNLTARFLQLRGEAREIQTRLQDRDRVMGELHEYRRQLAVFEEGKHREILIGYQRVQRQRRVMEERGKGLEALERCLRETVEVIAPSDTPVEDFNVDAEADAAALALADEGRGFEARIARRVEELADEAGVFRSRWTERVGASTWAARSKEAEQAYGGLIERLRAEGVEDPGAYGGLVQKYRALEQTKADLDEIEKRLGPLDKESVDTLDDLQALRRELTRRRRDHLEKVLKGNEFVRIEVRSYGGDPKEEEKHFRQYIGKDGPTFRNDIFADDQGLLADLYRVPEGDSRAAILEERCAGIRETLLTVPSGASDDPLGKPFRRHLQGLTEEQKDRIRMYWPSDSLRVQYRRRKDAEDWVDVKAGGSKGQKSVAVLAFLLASGKEPIVLDQPEDDLDNHVIYDLVVQRLREQKPLRQIVVATHNPNIVVNGDAEMVLAMDFRSGQCVVLEKETGCLQDQGVRKGICRVMEGGKEAFQKRYERIVRVVEEVNGA